MKELGTIDCRYCKNYKAIVYKRQLLKNLRSWRWIIKHSYKTHPQKKLQSYRKGKLFGIERAIALVEDLE